MARNTTVETVTDLALMEQIDRPGDVVNTLNGFRRNDHFVQSVLTIGAISGWLVNQIKTRRVGNQYYILCGLPTGERVEFCVSNSCSFGIVDGDGRISAHVAGCNWRKLHATLQAEVKRFRAAEALAISAIEAVQS